MVPLNYNINLHMAALYGNAYLNGQSYKVENNHIQVEESLKKRIIMSMFMFQHS